MNKIFKKIPQASNTISDSYCTLIVTENGLTANQLFNYSLALTPKIQSVSPSRGGTGGGTVLTIMGQNFPNNPAQVNVTIAGTQCTVSSITTNQIKCSTNSYMYSSIKAPVQVYILNNGFALNVSYF